MGLLEQIQTRLESGALRENLAPLFYDTLGWGAGKGSRRPVAVDGETLVLTPLAELGGLPVFHAEMPTGSKLPGIIYRRAVHKALTPTAQEHLLVYTTADQKQAQFVSARRVAGGKTELRTLPYTVGQPGRTTLERLAELAFAPTELGLYGDVPITQVMDRITRAFDVEAVTKAFFKEYRETFGAVEGMVRGVQGDRRLFTQRLFNRLMFIQFVARKGWLEFENSRDYLPALFAAAETKGENFYRDRLYWLFFFGLGTLADSREAHALEELQERRGRVPYLNGGLFEMVDADDVRGAVQIQNDAFAAILELFSRHNFTIMESAPLDVMVAVDPEMLGKVFEELVTGRHETGSYYTPRPVVAFMCREALKGYLTDALGGDSKTVREAVAAFVDDDDPAGLPNPEAALSALRRVTVCDPACGSGAYLLGMMQELLRLRASLFAAKVKDHAALYARKLEIIERNLYGADKDPFAVNIAMLRLWLSLVVDDERDPLHDPTADVSLPNLKFKICIGDSLTAPAPDLKGLSLQRDHYIADAEKLAALYDQYFLLAHDKQGRSKSDMEKQIAAVQKDIADLCGTQAPDGAVDWRVCFAEVFAPKSPVRTMDGRFAFANEVAAQQTFVEEDDDTGQSGFHIILANPPYVRADAQFKHLKPDEAARQKAIEEWKRYRVALTKPGYYETLYEKWDLYLPFLERAFQLLQANGRMVFIIPDAYNFAKYAARSHTFFLTRARLERVDFCSEIDLFDAGVNNTIIHFAKSKPSAIHAPVRVRRWGESREEFDRNEEILSTAPQLQSGASLLKVGGQQNEEAAEGYVPLEQVCYISVGMVIHADERKAHMAFRTAELISNMQDEDHPKPFIEGKNINKWLPTRIRYLEYGTERAPALFRRPTFPQLYEVPEKLISMDLAGSTPRVAYDSRRLYHNHSAWSFVPWHLLSGVRNKSIQKTAKYRDEVKPGEESPAILREELEERSRQFSLKYLLGIMNSAYAKEWLAKQRRSKLHIYPDDWKRLPIASATPEQQAEIVALVDKCLDAKGVGCEAWEAEIDEKVAALYRL